MARFPSRVVQISSSHTTRTVRATSLHDKLTSENLLSPCPVSQDNLGCFTFEMCASLVLFCKGIPADFRRHRNHTVAHIFTRMMIRSKCYPISHLFPSVLIVSVRALLVLVPQNFPSLSITHPPLHHRFCRSTPRSTVLPRQQCPFSAWLDLAAESTCC